MTTSATTPIRPIVALSFGACGSAAALRVCDPLLPYFAAQYDVGLAAAAQTVTGFAAAYGLLQLVYGPIGDRYGKYRVITFATIACAITSLACALAPTLTMLVVARVLAGATAGALIPLSLAWIGDTVAYERRQPVLARFLIGQIVGMASGQLLGGVGADYIGTRAVFLLLVAWFAAAAALLVHSRPPRSETVQHAQGSLARFAAVIRVRWSRVVLLTVFVEGLLFGGAFSFLPTHLHHQYGLPLTAAGSIVLLFAAGGFVYAVASPALVRRLGETGLATGGSVVLALCLAGVALSTVPALAIVACPIAGLGFYMLHNTLQVNATQMAPEQRGSSLALFACVLFVGQAIGASFVGVFAEHFGTAPAIAAAGVLLLGVGVGFARAIRRRH